MASTITNNGRVLLFIVAALAFWLRSEMRFLTGDGNVAFAQTESSAQTSYDKESPSYLNQTQLDRLSLCQRIPRGKSVAALWTDFGEDILAASMRHEGDPDGAIHGKWLQELLKLLTPRVLERGMLVFPTTRDLETIRTILDRKLQNPDTAPPLRIAVLGGSVPQGRGCDGLPSEVQSLLPPRTTYNHTIHGTACSWVRRWKMLADAFLGPGVVEVFNLATGGTQTMLSVPIMKYWLYRGALREARGPDVLVNAYATNDALYKWSRNSSTAVNATQDYQHYTKALGSARAFTRAAVTSRPKCRKTDLRPVVFFVQEYFGNQHELLLGEEIRADAVRNLAQHAGLAFVSSAFAVRPWVYANTNETVFSPNWYGKKGRIRDGHFGMPGHQTLAWVLAYASLQAMVEHCEDVRRNGILVPETNLVSGQADSRLVQTHLPPPQSWNTTPASIASDWQTMVDAQKEADQAFCKAASQTQEPCIFAFVSSQAGTHRKARKLQRYIKPFQTINTGWKAEDDMRNGWQNKLGLVAHEVSARVLFAFPNVTNRVRYITIHSLKSYGEKWDDSSARFDVSISDKYALEYNASFSIVGYHDQETSVTYPYVLDLGEEHSASIGKDFSLGITLTSGSNFKITGILLCSR